MNYFSNLLKLSGLIVFSLLLSACQFNRSTETTDIANPRVSHNGSFVWHDLISDDIDKARNFYGQLFGWKFVSTTGPNGKDYTLIQNKGRYIAGMVQLDDAADGENYSRWLGYMSVSDIEASLATTRAQQGTIILSTQTIAGIGEAAAILDPQGAVVGLVTSALEKPVHPDTPSTGDIVWNELLTSDPNKATVFYQALSDVHVEIIKRRAGEYRLLKTANINRAGMLQNPFDQGGPVWLSYFSVDDPASMANLAKTLGGEVLIAPDAQLREGTLALIADPTGALLVLEKAGTTNLAGTIQ